MKETFRIRQRPPFYCGLILATALCLWPGLSWAERLTLTVTPGQDLPDAAPGDGVCATSEGTCSLRAALDEATAQQRPVYITLASGSYPLREPLEIAVDTILEGAGAHAVTIETAPDFEGRRLLHYAEASRAWHKLQHLTVDAKGRSGGIRTAENVRLHLADVVVRHGHAQDDGGAIQAEGPLVLVRSSLVDNRADQGPGRGGAMVIHGAPAWITQTTLTGNQGGNSGGIFARDAQVTLEHTTIVGNVGRPVGGYQQNPGSTLTIHGSWLGETALPNGAVGLDCRSASRQELGIDTGGFNVIAVTGPTGQVLVNEQWQDSWEFFCAFDDPTDQAGHRDAPLTGYWQRVTGPTGLIAVAAGPDHPAYRAIPDHACSPTDAWGRNNPPGEPCDAGALRAPEQAPRAEARPDEPSEADEPVDPIGARPTWVILIAVLLVAALIMLWWRRR